MSFVIFSNFVSVFHSFCFKKWSLSVIILRIVIMIFGQLQHISHVDPFKSLLCPKAHFTSVNMYNVFFTEEGSYMPQGTIS